MAPRSNVIWEKIRENDWDAVLRRLGEAQGRTEARERNAAGVLPLIACLLEYTLSSSTTTTTLHDSILAMIDAFPESLMERAGVVFYDDEEEEEEEPNEDSPAKMYFEEIWGRGLDGALPLHVAFYYSARVPIELMRAMAERAPQALERTIVHGTTPLHLAAGLPAICEDEDVRRSRQCPSPKQTLAIYRLVYEACPEAAKRMDMEGHTILHRLCLEGTAGHADEVVSFLLDRQDNAAGARTKYGGYYPLLLACWNDNLAAETYERLYRSFPDAIPPCPSKNSALPQRQEDQKQGEVDMVDDDDHFDPFDRGVQNFLSRACSPLVKRRNSNDPPHNPGPWFALRIMPHASGVADGCLGYPLQVICMDPQRFSSEFCMAVLEANPAAAGEAPLPYHSICSAPSSPSHDGFVRAVLRAYPAAVRETSVCDRLPLHTVVAAQPFSAGMASSVLDAHPKAVEAKDGDGLYPFQVACRNPAPECCDFAIRLLGAHPEASRGADKWGRTPLHTVCDADCRDREDNARSLFRLCLAILEANSEAARAKDKDGILPLHLACKNDNSLPDAVATAVLESHPEAAGTKDAGLRTPLHLLCDNATTFAGHFPEALVKARLAAAGEKDRNGLLPLHLLCGNHRINGAHAASFAKTLIDAHPEAPRVQSKWGKLPFHFIESDNDEEGGDCRDQRPLINTILEAYPDAKDQEVNADVGKERLREEYGKPCFTWKLGDPCNNPNELDCLSDRVGGNTGFATYEANVWPCDGGPHDPNEGAGMFFVCQVNLANVPEKLKRLIGGDGLLQIFQETDSDSWADQSYIRLIPSSDFSRLVACVAMPSAALDEHNNPQSYSPKAFPIVGWEEHVDFPCLGMCDVEDYQRATEELGWEGDNLERHKFGGYGSYTQEGGGVGRCESCGTVHPSEIQFQMTQNDGSWSPKEREAFPEILPFGDSGTVQHRWCPTATRLEDTHSYEGACH